MLPAAPQLWCEVGRGKGRHSPPCPHHIRLRSTLLFFLAIFVIFLVYPSRFKEAWFPRRLLLMINARKQEHLASRCVGGLQTLPRPWKRSSSPHGGMPVSLGPWGLTGTTPRGPCSLGGGWDPARLGPTGCPGDGRPLCVSPLERAHEISRGHTGAGGLAGLMCTGNLLVFSVTSACLSEYRLAPGDPGLLPIVRGLLWEVPHSRQQLLWTSCRLCGCPESPRGPCRLPGPSMHAVGDGWTPGRGAAAAETAETRSSWASSLGVGLEVG